MQAHPETVMGVVVKLAPLPGEVIVAPCLGGAVEIVPSSPIDPVPAGGGVIAARVFGTEQNSIIPVNMARLNNQRLSSFIVLWLFTTVNLSTSLAASGAA